MRLRCLGKEFRFFFFLNKWYVNYIYFFDVKFRNFLGVGFFIFVGFFYFMWGVVCVFLFVNSCYSDSCVVRRKDFWFSWFGGIDFIFFWEEGVMLYIFSKKVFKEFE